MVDQHHKQALIRGTGQVKERAYVAPDPSHMSSGTWSMHAHRFLAKVCFVNSFFVIQIIIMWTG